MTAHESYRGVNVDHLYPDCPACPQPAKLQTGWVDTEGTDICGLCLARWRNRKEESDEVTRQSHIGTWKQWTRRS